MTQARYVASFALAFAASVLAVNLAADLWRVQGKAPPEYATWSGVMEVERKIRLLRQFARGGDVDVLVLSSSMGDLGVSGEVLSREMSAHLGRPYRVFNFSMGGADLTTYPELYRLARLAAKPREVWIVTPVSNPPESISPNSLDDNLLRGPVGRYERVPYMLRLSYEFFRIPIVRTAPAIRDAGLYLRFANRPVSNLDIYDIDAHGDTVSWLYNVGLYEHGAALARDRRSEILRLPAAARASDGRVTGGPVFGARTLAAVEEMKRLARRDGVTIRLVASDMAVALGMRDPEYLGASSRWFEALSGMLEAPVVDVRGSFALEPHMLSDSIHLNSIGAAQFSRLLAARMAGRPDPVGAPVAVPQKIRMREPDPAWTIFTALLSKPAGAPTATLWLDYLQNWGVHYLGPYSNVALALCTAAGETVLAPARVLSPGHVVADTSRVRFQAHDEVVSATLVYRNPRRVEPVGLPLASYHWSTERPDVDFEAMLGIAKVEPEADVFALHEPIRVRWEGIDGPSRTDWVGAFRLSDPDSARVSYGHTLGSSSGSKELPPTHAPGDYELRLYRNDGMELIATSKPFRVEGLKGALEVANPVAAVESEFTVRWKDINYPQHGDWVGLFPRGSKDVQAMQYTRGRRDGTAKLAVSKGVPAGDYEVRLYNASWTPLAEVAVRVVEAAK